MEGVFAEKMHATDRQYHREAYIRYENMQYPERVICVFVLLLVSFTELPLWRLSARPEREVYFRWFLRVVS